MLKHTKTLLLSAIAIATLFPHAAHAQSVPILMSGDGSFLGIITSNRVETKSICNSVGDYGSSVGSMSMRNRISDYGSQISDYSAYNRYASRPPVIVKDGEIVAIVSKNSSFGSRIDPDLLFYEVCGD